jgi:P27 family predicted phage terminase small subunit
VRVREEAGEPNLPTISAYPPRTLSKKAKRVWADIAHRVGPAGLRVMTMADVPALARLCELQVLWNRTRDALVDGDLTTTDGKGNVTDRPEVSRLIRLDERLEKLYSRFGLTPSDRARVQAIPSKPTAAEDESL